MRASAKAAGARGEEGQTLLLVAFSMIVLLGFMGLAVDVGYLRYVDRHMRSAADAAALSGANELLYSNNTGGVAGAAKADAAKDGFTDGVNGTTVTISSPPADGLHSCANDAANCNQYVEAILSQTQPTFFMKVFNVTTATVSARAVAWGAAANPKGCVYALDDSAANSLVVKGNSTELTVPTGNIMVNSSSSTGYTNSNSACVTANSIGVVGSASTWNGDCTAPKYGLVAVSDPLAYLQPPSVGSCPANPPSVPSGCNPYQPKNGLVCTATPPTALLPGTYCGGITVNSPAKVTLAAGTYVLNGGGLTVKSGANIVGNGVTFYNTGVSTGDMQYAVISVTGGSTTSLTAPTSGSLAGVLFFQDPNIPSNFTGASTTHKNTIAGVAGTVFTGALYFPNTPLTLSGGTSSNPFTLTAAVVADTVTVANGSHVTVQSLPPAQSPIHAVGLVE
ncbi:MAG TPA: pilus assembly protein TadG-related protein [Terriglobia bacterium]|nr:pilus assembly protein TadG-related protein [Terriglobia bacterium]